VPLVALMQAGSPTGAAASPVAQAKPKAKGGALCTLQADPVEWSQADVTKIDIDADRGIQAEGAEEALDNGGWPPNLPPAFQEVSTPLVLTPVPRTAV
jgi:hypothetical protein